MFGTHKKGSFISTSSEGTNEWQADEIHQYFCALGAITAAAQMREEGEQP